MFCHRGVTGRGKRGRCQVVGRVQESNVAHSVQEGKLDPPATLTLTSRRCNNAHHKSPAKPRGRARRTDFHNVTRWLVCLVIPFDTKPNRFNSRKRQSSQIPSTCCPLQLGCWTPPEPHICDTWNGHSIPARLSFTQYATIGSGFFSSKEKVQQNKEYHICRIFKVNVQLDLRPPLSKKQPPRWISPSSEHYKAYQTQLSSASLAW